MEEMIGESIRPHVEMMSTAEKIKEAFSTLDSINLQKFDLVSKAMAEEKCNGEKHNRFSKRNHSYG